MKKLEDLGDDERRIFDDYLAACHAMQSGVAAKMHLPIHAVGGDRETDPKHLRVGVNVALCDHGALVRLLVSKGLITDREYVEAIRGEMRAEVVRYREYISRATGVAVDLA